MTRRGFTLIELLVSITILMILAGVGVAGYRQSVRRQTIDAVQQKLTGVLRQAQTYAASGVKNCAAGSTLVGWWVNVGTGNYIIEGVCASAVGNLSVFNSKSELYPTGVVVTTLPNPNPILFKVLNQGTNVVSSTSVIITGFNLTRTITVTSAGEIK